jgi:hypothetical protein
MRRKVIAAVAVVLAAALAAGWFLRAPLLLRYHVARLESDEAAVERVASLG